MKVSVWMSQPVIVATPRDSARKAADVMRLANVHHMPVIDQQGEVIGIVSDRDLAKPRWVETAASEAVTVGQRMSDVVLSVGPNDDIADVGALLVESHTNAVPVVGPGGEVHGILTIADVVRALLAQAIQIRT